LAREADHAVFGADVDLQAVEVVADQIAGLDLAGDPAVADGRPGLVGAVLGLGRGGAGCTDAEQVVDVADAIGVGRQTPGQLLGFRAARLTLEGDHSGAGVDVHIHAFGIAVPQQLGFDRRGEGRVLDALGQIAFGAGFARLGRRIDLQAVVDLLDAVDAKGNLLGKIAVDIALDAATENGGAVLDINVDGERIEVAVERDGGPDGAFLTRLAQVGRIC